MNSDILPKQYKHEDHEEAIYAQWEEAGAFTPQATSTDPNKEPFSILMPPPNANASLHAGHAMYVIQDIMTRFKRMQGHPTVWFPGTDHAGFETQFVYEKHLKKEKKSRFQFDRETLYENIFDFVKQNSGLIENQMRRLGFSADWSQKTFTLDEHVIKTVHETFSKLAKDGLIYRDNYLVNYCPKCGTTFADLEVTHEDQTSPLYYVRYRFSDGEPRIINGEEIMYITVATVRPETIFADAAVAIHPEDPRAKALHGEYVLNPLTKQPIPIIEDEYVDPEFGTGMLKITPAHDPNDFELGKKHDLPLHVTINTLGKIDLEWHNPEQEPAKGRAEQLKTQFHNQSIFHARPAVVKLLEAENSLEKIDEKYQNKVTVCYKGKHTIEPLPYPNWFVNMEPLAKLGLEAVEQNKVELIPSRFVKQYQQWLENIRDWPISRQIVWGIRMPVWYNARENTNIFVSFLDTNGERHNLTLEKAYEAGFELVEIRAGLQSLIAPTETPFEISPESPGDDFIQETDTFDTWFSSGQWPLVVLKYPDGENFQQFYPTSLLDTMWDILFFWVARMIMLGTYLTGDVPFKHVYLHSMVTDSKGAKMSKSKGNVINPLDIVEKYGADALRIALVAGSAPGNPIALSEPKVKGYRNFGNKIWNIGRFIQISESEHGRSPAVSEVDANEFSAEDTKILNQLDELVTSVTENLEKFRFSDAALGIYDFLWNDFANGYLENNKDRTETDAYRATVSHVYFISLQLLHPFMPFVTEAVWQQLRREDRLLITSQWPE
ncbi:valine--tRNA ligase [Candidatus Woesebacteria bacterium]|nr:valine--tRNA ligase [Candidatus Woesebacteria bacterium]MCD8527307.1 valine--tRNA ligase [Candidatus Woesebacteria bacterium]MCD8546672.1 valine--tRNA ligase [Candidatus Woesebacteria bacterium]